MNHFYIITLIVVFCGFFGGLINFLRSFDSFKNSFYAILKSLLTGLAASCLVPLFFKMISSNLLVSSQNNFEEYFVIGGFCLIASIFSSSFIDAIGNKFLKEIKDVKEKIKEYDDSITENDYNDDNALNDEFEKLDQIYRDILIKFFESKYTYRSITGISKELSLSKSDTEIRLNNLMKEGYIDKIFRNNSYYKWKLTEKGKEIGVNYYTEESSGSGSAE